MLPPLPDPPSEPARPSFPVVAVAAPLVGAVVIGLVTGSPFVLLFALLSPLIAIGSLLDARRSGRRTRRREEARFDQDCSRFAALLADAHQEESEEELRSALSAQDGESGRLLLGVAPGASRHRITGPSASGQETVGDHDRRLTLARQSAVNPALPVAIPRGAVRVVGASVTARHVRRALAAVPGVELRDESSSMAGGVEDVVEIAIEGLRHACVTLPGHAPRRVRLILPSDHERVARAAEAESFVLPDRVDWSELRDDHSAGVALGRDGSGQVVGLDLLGDGPHVLVGGTTGSGKSEFLRVLALSIAAQYSPAEWSLLLVDFKGGSTFADLERLPHCAGVITDLDDALADRALGSLRAEITRRERLLLAQRARDLRDCADPFPRLLVLVDEYAALVQSFPELQQVFADLSARGRSLGIHLVLCTQRPHGVVRDAVVANCAIRVVFRTTETADARAVLGADAPDVRTLPPGRALFAAGGTPRAVQLAMIGPGDLDSVARAAEAHPVAAPPWAPPLPSHLALDEVAHLRGERPNDGTPLVDSPPEGPAASEELAFGALDDVSGQCWRPARWRPAVDGALAVLGAPGTGRTSALATLAAVARGQGRGVIHVPSDLADAAEVLGRLAADPPPRTLVVLDDLDELMATATASHGSLLLERWDRAVAALRVVGGAAAAVLGTATAASRLLAGRFGARLCLRALDEDDHALSGAPRRGHDRRAPAGRAWWFEQRVQVAQPPGALPAPARPTVPIIPLDSGPLAIVAADPARVIARLLALDSGCTIVTALDAVSAEQVVGTTALDRPLLVGDAEDWQRAWSLWSSVRRHVPLVVDGLTDAEVRALLGARTAPPPLNSQRGEVLYRPADSSGSGLLRARWPDDRLDAT